MNLLNVFIGFFVMKVKSSLQNDLKTVDFYPMCYYNEVLCEERLF